LIELCGIGGLVSEVPGLLELEANDALACSIIAGADAGDGGDDFLIEIEHVRARGRLQILRHVELGPLVASPLIGTILIELFLVDLVLELLDGHVQVDLAGAQDEGVPLLGSTLVLRIGIDLRCLLGVSSVLPYLLDLLLHFDREVEDVGRIELDGSAHGILLISVLEGIVLC